MAPALNSPADRYARMRLIRGFEEQALALVRSGEIVGGIHPYIGEEAVAVGVCAALVGTSSTFLRCAMTTSSPAPTAGTVTSWPRAPTRAGC